VERFLGLIQACLLPVKERKATRPTRVSVEKRIREKKIRGEKKRSRQEPDAE
jgi:ribosome-associated protein